MFSNKLNLVVGIRLAFTLLAAAAVFALGGVMVVVVVVVVAVLAPWSPSWPCWRLLEHNRCAVHVLDPVSACVGLRFNSAENAVRRISARARGLATSWSPTPPPRDAKVFAIGVLKNVFGGTFSVVGPLATHRGHSKVPAQPQKHLHRRPRGQTGCNRPQQVVFIAGHCWRRPSN